MARAATVTPKPDMVNHPPHYASGGVECIDAIRAQLTREELIGFLRGQVAKYNWRLNQKDEPLENAQKCGWYLNLLIEVLGE